MTPRKSHHPLGRFPSAGSLGAGSPASGAGARAMVVTITGPGAASNRYADHRREAEPGDGMVIHGALGSRSTRPSGP